MFQSGKSEDIKEEEDEDAKKPTPPPPIEKAKPKHLEAVKEGEEGKLSRYSGKMYRLIGIQGQVHYLVGH